MTAKDTLEELAKHSVTHVGSEQIFDKQKAIDEASQALYQQIKQLVGADEKEWLLNEHDVGAAVRNQFRKELRQKLKEYFGQEEV